MVTMRDVVRYIHENGVKLTLSADEVQKAVDLVNERGESDTLDKWGMIDNALYDLYINRVEE